MDSIKDLEKTWEYYGENDALWSILTLFGTKEKKWDEKEFFYTGKLEIDFLLRYVEELPVRVTYNTALDFGCGVGRLTQALCHYFNRVQGVDISENMVRLANRFNKHEETCSYLVNKENNLSIIKSNSVDFIISFITLQHVGVALAESYITEFLRILSPNGLAVFSLPSEPDASYSGESFVLDREYFYNRILPTLPGGEAVTTVFGKSTKKNIIEKIFDKINFKNEKRKINETKMKTGVGMSMDGIKKDTVVSLINKNGGDVLAIKKTLECGPEWVNYRYFVTTKK